MRDGNYAAVVLDLRGCAERALRRTPSSLWYRLQRAAEGCSVAVLVQTTFPLVPAVPWRLVLDTPLSLADAGDTREGVAARLAVRTERSHPGDPRGAGGMRYAVLSVPDFALHALRRSEPGLCGRPVALVAGEGRKARVTEASAEALGVAPGLAATLAMSRCPGIVLRPRDPSAEVEAQRLLVAAAFTLSPRVESTGPGCCTIDLQGADPARAEALMRLRAAELANAGLPARVGAGATPLLASYAARCAEPVLVVRDTGGFLGAAAPLVRGADGRSRRSILRGWGIATLGGLTALAKAEVGRRMGADGVLLWERAAGEATRVLRHVEPARSFAAQWAYEPPVESTEPLFFKLRRYAERVALELRGAGFVAEKLSLTLLLEDGADHRREFRLPEPGADVEGWLRVLNSHLAEVRTDARVSGVRLVAAPARPPEKQEGLFDTGLRDPASFWENLARIAAIVGDDRVGTPAPVDTPPAGRLHDGEARRGGDARPRGRRCTPTFGPTLRRFRPPWPVRVACEAGAPARLEGGRLEGRVRAALGPWRSAGDWWRPEAWAVETWQVELAAGGLYQLARTADGWLRRGDAGLAGAPAMPYVELHARSAFSFLRAGSLPEALVAEAGPPRDPGHRALRPRRRLRGRAAPHVREGGGRAGARRVRAHDGGRERRPRPRRDARRLPGALRGS